MLFIKLLICARFAFRSVVTNIYMWFIKEANFMWDCLFIYSLENCKWNALSLYSLNLFVISNSRRKRTSKKNNEKWAKMVRKPFDGKAALAFRIHICICIYFMSIKFLNKTKRKSCKTRQTILLKSNLTK